MPWGRNSRNVEDAPPRPPSLWLRFQNAVVKPDDAAADAKAKAAGDDRSVEQIEGEIARANDKERAVGLIAGPIGGVIGLLINSALIAHDPAARLSNGAINRLHVSVSLYNELLGVLIATALLMVVTALLRKRLFLGISMALYGLAIFNLHYWGFGIPYVMFGAWLLVRAYRLQQALKLAGGGASTPRPKSSAAPRASLPRPNKRYTPRTAPARRPSKPKPDNHQKAG